MIKFNVGADVCGYGESPFPVFFVHREPHTKYDRADARAKRLEHERKIKVLETARGDGDYPVGYPFVLLEDGEEIIDRRTHVAVPLLLSGELVVALGTMLAPLGDPEKAQAYRDLRDSLFKRLCLPKKGDGK